MQCLSTHSAFWPFLTYDICKRLSEDFFLVKLQELLDSLHVNDSFAGRPWTEEVSYTNPEPKKQRQELTVEAGQLCALMSVKDVHFGT